MVSQQLLKGTSKIMAEAITTGGSKAIGYTEIRSGICKKCHIQFEVPLDEEGKTGTPFCPRCKGTVGELLVAFNSEEAEEYWGSQYQKERIKYAMRHRRDKIPMRLRTGAKTLILRIVGLEPEAKRLHDLNEKEGGQVNG